jgi:hypothetical protein
MPPLDRLEPGGCRDVRVCIVLALSGEVDRRAEVPVHEFAVDIEREGRAVVAHKPGQLEHVRPAGDVEGGKCVPEPMESGV